jgi:Na+/H+ antiporter NhaD/arsenite permease-like protein
LPNTILVAIPITFAGFIIFYEKSYGKIIFKEGVDWWTIIFFMFLFAKAACLEYTGVTTKIAFSLLSVSEKFSIPFLPQDLKIITTALVIITSFTGLASGFVDNLPIIAALVPLVKTIQATGFKYSSILWWGLLFGGCFGGNLTMIGSSANIVAISLYEKSEGKTIGFQRWFKYGVPVVFLSLVFSILLLIIQIRWAK